MMTSVQLAQELSDFYMTDKNKILSDLTSTCYIKTSNDVLIKSIFPKIADPDCWIIEEATEQQNDKIKDDFINMEDFLCVQLKESTKQINLPFLQVQPINENSEEISIVSEKKLTGSTIASITRNPCNDCIIISEDNTQPKEPTDCITIDDEENSHIIDPKETECIVLDDQDILVTENLNPSKALVSKAFLYTKADYVNGLKKLVQSGLDLNCINSRRWTLLMMASFIGSISVLRYLLSKKVDLDKKDRRNNTAYSLANEQRQRKVINIIKRYKKQSRCRNSSLKLEDFYCEICKQNIPKCDKMTHDLSIIHQSKLKPHDSFHICSKNIGYQMLLKSGWDGKTGLGKDSQGNKFPIQTETKNNRLGIGHIKITKAENKSIKFKRNKKQNSTNRNNQVENSFHINAKNIGYQMLLKCGWDGKNGLGRISQGIKFPIKSEVKQNKFGLGHDNNFRQIKLKNLNKQSLKKKLTNKEKKTIKKEKKLIKKEKILKRKQEKNMVANLRRLLN